MAGQFVLSTYPSPHTVCRKRGVRGSSSILRRRRVTCTSIVRSPAPLCCDSLKRDRVTPGCMVKTQQVGLAPGQGDQILAAPQLHAVGVEAEGTEVDRAAGGSRRLGAAQDAVDAQHKLARLERLGEIVVGAALQPGDAVVGFAHGGQHQHRRADRFANSLGQADAVFAGHHDVDDQQVEGEAGQLGFRVGGTFRGADQKILVDQIFSQQFAQTPVVVDDQDMRLFGHVLSGFG